MENEKGFPLQSLTQTLSKYQNIALNEVANNITQAVFIEHSLYECNHTIDTIYIFCQTSHSSPGQKKLIRSKE